MEFVGQIGLLSGEYIFLINSSCPQMGHKLEKYALKKYYFHKTKPLVRNKAKSK